MTNSRLFLAILLALCVSYAVGHSYVTSPQSRTNQKVTQSGCRGPNCLGPCDAPLSASRTPATTIARGASINVQWPRNNHAGGFIRFAWAQTSASDIQASFDNGVEEIHCHEIGGCGPSDPADPNGGDNGAADGSYKPCQTTIQVPSYLTDGKWTLQWAWFGGAFALGDYYSCVDYIISGGVAVTATQPAPVFYGGDYTYPNQPKCKFFNTDRLHECVDEPCNNPIYPASQEESGPAYGIAIASGSNQNPPTTGEAEPVTTGEAEPITSGRVIPITSGRVIPITSGRVKPLTTSVISTPLTTHKKGSTSTTSPKTPLTTGAIAASPSVTNCALLTNVLNTVTTSITTVDTWSNIFRMVVQIDANADVSNWMMLIVWPDEATDTEVQDVFNAGDLKCQASQPERHSVIAPVASWASTIKAGEQMFVEVRAVNTNMNSQFIMSNTQIIMYTTN